MYLLKLSLACHLQEQANCIKLLNSMYLVKVVHHGFEFHFPRPLLPIIPGNGFTPLGKTMPVDILLQTSSEVISRIAAINLEFCSVDNLSCFSVSTSTFKAWHNLSD